MENFISFRNQFNLSQVWPVTQMHIIAFISFLSVAGKAAASISSSISALSFVHKVNGWSDPTASFLISKLKEGCRRLHPQSDRRLPLTPTLLERIINSLPLLCCSQFEGLLFRSAFLMAFFGFLRVSEFTCKSKNAISDKVLALCDVSIDSNGKMLNLRIRYSKTDQRGASTTLTLFDSDHQILSPVKALRDYLLVRPQIHGPLFVHFNGEPLLSFQFSRVLKESVKFIGLNPENFSSHSFRIGAATAAALGGLSEEEIKKLGRWKSSAYRSYIRPHFF